MFLLLVWYFLNYLWGCRENERIKILFLKEFEGLFREQFAHVGPGCVSGMDGNGGWGNGSSLEEEGEKEAHNGEEKKGLVMHKDSNSSFQLWASGRRHVPRGMAITLDLQKRHDLFTKLWERFFPSEDVITLEAGLNPEEVAPFVLALSRRLHHRSLHLTTPDIFNYTTLLLLPVLLPALDTAHFVVYADNDAVVPLVLPPALTRVLEEHKPWFERIHVSDQNTTPVGGHPFLPPVILRARFLVPTNEADMHTHLRPLLSLVFELLDHVAGGKVRLSEAARRRSKEVRAVIEAKKLMELQKAHQQEREWKKREKQRREQEAYARLTPEQKRRKEEKDAKKKRHEEAKRWARTHMS